jgi:hypothetical protein
LEGQVSIYPNRARRSRDRDTEIIIGDSPVTVTRQRKDHTDKFREPTTKTAGPYTVRIEGFKATRNAIGFDEKGTTATAAYVLIGLDIPRWQDDAETDATFRVDDTIIGADGNYYRVTSPARWDGRVVEINIELFS